MTVLSDVIRSAPDCIRPTLCFLERRFSNDNEPRSRPPEAFASWRDGRGHLHRVRIVAATRAGRVGISHDLSGNGTADRFVSLNELSDFLPTAYRMKPRRHRSVSRPQVATASPLEGAETRHDVLEWVCTASGLSIAQVTGSCRDYELTVARRVVAGILLARQEYSYPQIGATLKKDHTTIMAAADSIGLRRSSLPDIDTNYLRAIWSRGPLPIGYEAGQVPQEVVTRLGEFVTTCGTVVDATMRHVMFHQASARIARQRNGRVA